MIGSVGEQHVWGGGGTGQFGPAFHAQSDEVRHPAFVSRWAHGGDVASFIGSSGAQHAGFGGGGVGQVVLAVQAQNADEAQSLNAVRFAQGVLGSS